MNLIIPFTKDIKFTSNISEITIISLKHEFTVNNDEILGNFIVSGDYKTHELSVNKEHFEIYKDLKLWIYDNCTDGI